MKKGIDFPGISIIFACHDGAGNYLFAKRSKNCRDEHGTWDPGGGGLEFGDSVEDTLRKEITEEYGTRILRKEFLGYRDVHRIYDGQKTHWITLDFRVWVDRRAVRNAEPHKHEEIGWFRLDQLPAPLHSQFPYFIEKYRHILTKPT